jgi:hypothetical protein
LDEVSQLFCGDNQIAVFQGVDDVFLVFICRVFWKFMDVVVEKVIYFAGVVFVVYDDTSFAFVGVCYHCIFLPSFLPATSRPDLNTI